LLSDRLAEAGRGCQGVVRERQRAVAVAGQPARMCVE